MIYHSVVTGIFWAEMDYGPPECRGPEPLAGSVARRGLARCVGAAMLLVRRDTGHTGTRAEGRRVRMPGLRLDADASRLGRSA